MLRVCFSSTPIPISHPVTATARAVPIIVEGASMFSPVVVIGMASRTIRGIAGRGPRDRLIITGVAIGTNQTNPMISRIVTGEVAIVERRQPGRGCMTAVALLSGDEVTGRHTRCSAAVVTAITTAAHPTVIDADAGPGGR